MWGWIIKVTMISLLLIFLLHYLYSFFKTTLTSPKLKDLVNKPQAKYDTIYNSLKSAGDGGKQNLGEDNTTTSEGNNNSNFNSNSNSNSSSMKDELKKYLKELHVSNNNSGGGGSGGSGTSTIGNKNIINPHNEANTSLYSPNSIMTGLGANGISTRVNNTSNYMPNINNNSGSNVQPDYGTPSMSSSYASAYSPY
jgi:translation initiation factor 2-alpha kinase 4